MTPFGPLARLAVALLCVAVLSACAGEPNEVAARGAEELERHRVSEWVRIEHPMLDEVSYEANEAYVDPAHPGAVDFDIEVPTTFRQRFVTAGLPDRDLIRDLIDDVRTSLIERGAIARGSTCGPQDQLTTWHFSAKSQGDWLRIGLTERLDGLDHVVTVHDRPGFTYADNPCP